MTITRTFSATTGALALAALLASCASADSLSDNPDTGGETIVVGSQDYYSNEIIAEIYAQALESAGYDVQRDFRIGQREVTVPELENGSIDLFPEYTGPLLSYWEPDTEATLAGDVYDALVAAAPDSLQILDQSTATDQDAYVVTRAFSEQYDVVSVGDLAKVPVPVILGGNSEGLDRPIGPAGLQATYGVDVDFTPIEDGGGPLTLQALRDNSIQLAVLYTANPAFTSPDLVQLDDPEGLIFASHVVPVASDALDGKGVAIINAISAALTPDGLVALNAQSQEDESPAATVAADWLAENPLG